MQLPPPQAVSPAAQQVNNEMTQRQADPAIVNTVAEPLSKLAGDTPWGLCHLAVIERTLTGAN